MDNIWSTQDEATLVQLVGAEEKYKNIATHLGKSINAICAKVKRMRDLKEIPSRAPRTTKHLPRSQKAADPEGDEKAAVDYAGFKRAAEEMEREAEAMKDQLLTLEDLPEDGCHYVVGDPTRTGKVYCNGTAVLPGIPGKCYCETHLARMFRAPSVVDRTNHFVAKRPIHWRSRELEMAL